MRIAFDAKRAYQNNTGLGNYSRVLMDRLALDYPEHDYYAMTPKLTDLYKPASPRIRTITPTGLAKTFSAAWRSKWVKSDLKKLSIDIYHGLSHEIPIGIQDTGIKSVVTIHDLIFENYPKQFKPIDVAIYRKKFTYACKHADKIVTVSESTKNDIVKIYGTDPGKIEVTYIAAGTKFEQQLPEGEKERIRKQYQLPQQFFLYVGSIIERKNLLKICKAIAQLKGSVNIPLVVIGGADSAYAQEVTTYIQQQHLDEDVVLYPAFRRSEDLPGIYQMATALILPSIYEGFGLPVLEGLLSGTPVITSNISSLPEVGGDAALYIDPNSVDELAGAMKNVAADDELRERMVRAGLAQAQKFTPSACAKAVMDVYRGLFLP
jgi:glycosyltransferase involved in cell wall biosynthesis